MGGVPYFVGSYAPDLVHDSRGPLSPPWYLANFWMSRSTFVTLRSFRMSVKCLNAYIRIDVAGCTPGKSVYTHFVRRCRAQPHCIEGYSYREQPQPSLL